MQNTGRRVPLDAENAIQVKYRPKAPMLMIKKREKVWGI